MTEQEEESVNKLITRTIRETEFTMISKYQGALYLLLASLKENGPADIELTNEDYLSEEEGRLHSEYKRGRDAMYQKLEFELHLLHLKIEKDFKGKWEKDDDLKHDIPTPRGLIV